MLHEELSDPPRVDDPELWRTGVYSVTGEVPDPVELEVQGALPPDLQGTLYRNGPGRFEIGRERRTHWFDGHGLVHAITLRDGRATYRNRFVATRTLAIEGALGRVADMGFRAKPTSYLARFTKDWVANTANTSVVAHAGRLLALYEGGHPYALEPETIATVGPDDLGGALPSYGCYSAHPKKDPRTGELWNVARIYRKHAIRLYKTAADGTTTEVASLRPPIAAYQHDFGLTATRAVILLGPAVVPLIPLQLILRTTSFADLVRWRPELGSRIAIVDRATGTSRWLRAEPFFFFHLVRAWDEGEDVVVDACLYPDADFLAVANTFVGADRGPSPAYAPPHLERIRISADGKVTRRRLAELPLELPVADGADWGAGEPRRCYALTWNEGSRFYGTPVAVDMATGVVTRARQDERTQFCSESLPVARPGAVDPREAWVLTIRNDVVARTSELVVLEAGELSAPPVATLPLPTYVPFGFHGTWFPATPGGGAAGSQTPAR